LTWRRPDAKARNAQRQNRRNKEKAAKAANNLKKKEKRELDKQGKLSILYSIIIYYFSNFNF